MDISIFGIMCGTIYLNRELQVRTIEIQYIWSDTVLSSKFVSEELFLLQANPQNSF